MKITFLDIYKKSKYKISKNTNAGMGTANNYGTNFLAKLQNILIKKSIHYPPQNCLYSMAVLRSLNHEILYSDELVHNESDIYIFKVDSSGNKIWDNTFGGMAEDVGYSIANSDDGGYLIASQTRSYGKGGSDGMLVKFDSNGKKEWEK